MTKEQTALLLTTARLLRAHLRDHKHDPGFNHVRLDWDEINEALRPFDPSQQHGGDFVAKDRK